jgi:hypothetical protein
MRFLFASLFVILLGAPAQAFDWGHYANARFGFSIDIPPEFSQIAEADNGDGGTSMGPDKLSQLAVWGSNLVEGTLADDFASRLEAAKADGWEISYSRETPRWASWSGSQQGRIFYARAIVLCDDQIAYFLFEYPRARLESYRPFVERLVKSLKNARSC